MKTGDTVLWGGCQFQILVEYDDEFLYLDVGNGGAQLAHRSDLQPITKH